MLNAAHLSGWVLWQNATNDKPTEERANRREVLVSGLR
jgi:hypothetical protein